MLKSLLEAPGALYRDPHCQPQVRAGSVQVELLSREA
jgi:hypothetical protein